MTSAPRPASGRPAGRPGGARPHGRPGGRRFSPRPKVCALCVEKAKGVDYKDSAKLGRYISERGRIEPRRRSGACAKHQRMLCEAIKRARHLALLPYTTAHIHGSGGVGVVERPPRIRPEGRRFEGPRSYGPPQSPPPPAAAPAAPVAPVAPAPPVAPQSAERGQSAQANVPAKEA